MEPIFVNYFWGERHQGFEVLQHNLKYGLRATADFLEFMRETCSLQDNYQKALHKLSRQAGLYANSGSFTPCWSPVRQLLEKQSTCHLELQQQWATLLKDAQRYFEEQTRRHKEFRDGEVATLEVVNSFQSATQQLHKARDMYHARYMDYDKIRRVDTVSAKELERAEVRLRKAQNEYKYLIERYNNSRNAFLDKMNLACSHFQEVEYKHLEQMREFVRRFGQVWVTQVQESSVCLQDYEHNLANDRTVAQLLLHFANEKGTGTQAPTLAVFEDGEVAAAFADRSGDRSGSGSQRSSSRATNSERPPTATSHSNEKLGTSSRKNSVPDLLAATAGADNGVSESGSVSTATVTTNSTNTTSRTSGGFFFKKNRKKTSETTAPSGSKAGTPTGTGSNIQQQTVNDWRCETPMERPVDEQGYSLPPEDLHSRPGQLHNVASSNSSSNSSSEDEDEVRGFPKVVIRPMEEVAGQVLSGDTLPRISRDSPILMAQPPPPLGGGRLNKGRGTPQLRGTVNSVKQQVSQTTTSLIRSSNDTIVDEQSSRKSPVDAWGVTSEPTVDYVDIALPTKAPSNKNPTTLEKDTGQSQTKPNSTVDPFGSPLHSPMEAAPVAVLQPFAATFNSNSSQSTPTPPPVQPPVLPLPPSSLATQFSAPQPTTEPLDKSDSNSIPLVKAPILPPRPKTSEPPLNNPLTVPKRQTVPELPPMPSLQEPKRSTIATLPSQSSSRPPPPLPPPDGTLSRSLAPHPPPPPPLPVMNSSLTSSYSRGPSPAPLGPLDPIPLAAATTEIYHAKLYGGEGNILERRVDGELSIAFPTAVLRRFIATGPQQPAVHTLEFQLMDTKGQLRNLNWDARFFTECRQLDCDESSPAAGGNMLFFMNMVSLRDFMMEKHEAEPDCKYFSVDLLKYQVHLPPDTSSPPPLSLQTHWHSESAHEVHLRVEYTFPSDVFLPVDLAITCPLPGSAPWSDLKMQSVPEGVIRLTDGVAEWALLGRELKKTGVISAKFTVQPGEDNAVILKPQQVHAQFMFTDRQCSEAKFHFPSPHYRLSLYKRRVISGQYYNEPQDEMQFL